MDIEINSSVEYGLRFLSGSAWVSEGAARAISTHTVHFEVIPNESYDSREAKILFYDKENALLNDTITIYQAYKSTFSFWHGI